MKDFTNNNQHRPIDYSAQANVASKSFLSNVFLYMTGALSITGIVAYAFGTNPALNALLIGPTGGLSILGMIAAFSPLIFVLVMSFSFHRLSSMALLILFIIYSAMTGMSFGVLFLTFSESTLLITFGVTAATFGTMALVGYTTQTDLTKFGSILFMALIGIIIASLVNMFAGSSMLDTLISCAGVLIFTGLTAYDVQRLKRIGQGIDEEGVVHQESASKMAIIGALSLYLNFINLFLFLLRFFGGSRD